MAAPSKFTREIVEALLAGIAAGLPYDLAAQAAGISPTTFYEWQAGKFPRTADKDLKAQFSEELTRAKGTSAAMLVAAIRQATPNDWRAAAWLLERRFPRDFGKDQELYERLERIEAILAESGPPPLRRVG